MAGRNRLAHRPGARVTGARLLKSFLYGVSASDPITFTAIALMLLTIAFLACWIPARPRPRRASRVDQIDYAKGGVIRLASHVRCGIGENNRPCSSGSNQNHGVRMNTEGAAAAELALKAYTLRDPDVLHQFDDADGVMRRIADSIDLTEAPEDAACSLVIDLMHYCDREKINWNDDVLSRAHERFESERKELQLR
ncbi:MAG: hypothetical protein H0X73_06255 [Chthoniobacterales bacterium]|nr:hypothetical protein [Chthoniobacterales bacterium]